MAITVVDELQAQDWDRYAAFIGPFLPGLLFAVALLGFAVGQHMGTQVCVLLSALAVALIETPGAFFLCPPCHRLRDRLIEDWGFGKGWVRGLTYGLLSLACFLPHPSVAILAGILLVLAAAVNLCASLFADEPILLSSSGSTAAASKPPGAAAAATTVLPSYQPPHNPANSGGGGARGGAGGMAAAGATATGSKQPSQSQQQPAVVAGFGTFNL